MYPDARFLAMLLDRKECLYFYKGGFMMSRFVKYWWVIRYNLFLFFIGMLVLLLFCSIVEIISPSSR